MSKREPGKFRGTLFGGFNRKDVLTYIASVYEELEQSHEENEMLRERCNELENLLQNLDKSASRVPLPKLDKNSKGPPVVRPPSEPKAETPAEATAEMAPETPDMIHEPETVPIAPTPATTPVEAATEQPHTVVKPSLANPYPGRATRVKVRPTRTQD